jgi:hypothetical protein
MGTEKKPASTRVMALDGYPQKIATKASAAPSGGSGVKPPPSSVKPKKS